MNGLAQINRTNDEEVAQRQKNGNTFRRLAERDPRVTLIFTPLSDDPVGVEYEEGGIAVTLAKPDTLFFCSGCGRVNRSNLGCTEYSRSVNGTRLCLRCADKAEGL